MKSTCQRRFNVNITQHKTILGALNLDPKSPNQHEMSTQPTRRAVKPTEKARVAAEEASSRAPRKRRHSTGSDSDGTPSSAPLNNLKGPRKDEASRSVKSSVLPTSDVDDNGPAASETDRRERSPSVVEIDNPVTAEDELSESFLRVILLPVSSKTNTH